MSRFRFLLSLLGLTSLVGCSKQQLAEFKRQGTAFCPVDDTRGVILGSVAVGPSGQEDLGVEQVAAVGWMSGLRLLRCPSCGLLFSQEIRNTESKQ